MWRKYLKNSSKSKFDKKLKVEMDKLYKLVCEKNKAYGDSIGSSEKIFRLYYPNGIRTDQYGDILLMARILDKLSRIANKKDAFGENAYVDILGYAVRGCIK